MSICYFFVDIQPDVSYEESYLRCICEICRHIHYKEKSNQEMMFYDGPFGDFDVNCYKCNKILNKVGKN